MNTPGKTELAIPPELQSSTDRVLPLLSQRTINDLTEAGWSRVGLVVPLITRAAKLVMFSHTESPKARSGMLGPLGETSRGSDQEIEQPLATLYRGLQEETGTPDPQTLGLRVARGAGWFTNRWPVGINHPGQYALALCPPIYVPPHTEERLLAHPHGNEEIAGVQIMSSAEIRATDPRQLRPGVVEWVSQLESTGFLDWPAESHELNFSALSVTRMVDLELRRAPKA